MRGQIIIDLAVQTIPSADLDRIKPVEHIELGQRYAGHPRHGAALAHNHGVKPSTAALASRNGAKFMAAFTQSLAGFILKLGRERP